MCGISGIINKNGSLSLKDSIYGMNHAIKHRGPDGEGFAFFSDTQTIPAYSNETPLANRNSEAFLYNPKTAYNDVNHAEVVFGHRRLSIIDLSEAGHQPMCDQSGDYWITYNGEIYNYIELREILSNKGHQFITQTDTEVIIEAYKEWGINCLEHFNGMWAFALFDRKNNYIFCARDRVGVKPFYYVNNERFFAFASEYKAFIKSGLVAFDVNAEAQFDFILKAEIEQGTQSLFKHICELKPAHYGIYKVKSNEWRINRYYQLPKVTEHGKSEAQLIEQIEIALVNAVKLRLRSDVEVGSCLSGGLDSSLISGIIHHLQKDHALKLFTAVYPGESFDESRYAKVAADFVKGSWETVSPTAEEFFRDIEQLNYSQDLPVWGTSTYSQHRVMQLASQHGIKVVLDGQGADELFAGYAHHFLALWREYPFFKRVQLINESKVTIARPWKFYLTQTVKHAFALTTNYDSFFSDAARQHFKNQFEPFCNELNKQLETDYQGRLKSFLKCEDRCGMAFGIESRVPFADDLPLVELLFKTEGKHKIKQGISKHLLREAGQVYLPELIRKRTDKIGFETPVVTWLSTQKEQILETISKLDFVKTDFIKTNFDSILKEQTMMLFRLYSIAIWKDVFVKNSSNK